MKEETNWKVNRFLSLAEDYIIHPTEDEEVAKIDMTEEFWKELDIEIRDDELIDININAKVRMSKSTIGMKVGQEIMKLLIKHKKTECKNFGISNIARDQQEYTKMMRDVNTRNTVIVTDEINELEETGANVTVEKALGNVFSNVQAGRYVHRICCSPKGVTDANADIFLEVISKDIKKKVSTCYLYYRVFKRGQTNRILLGHVNFYVGDLIHNWLKIKDVFNKEGKTEKEAKFIEKLRKTDFYVEYMIKKYEKMELITREGILRPRMLDYAEVILGVEERLRELAKLNILGRETVKNYVKMYCRQLGISTSIIGEDLMSQEVVGILSLWKSLHGINKNIDKRCKNLERTDAEEKDLDMLKTMRNELMVTINAQLTELRHYKEINEKYNVNMSDKK